MRNRGNVVGDARKMLEEREQQTAWYCVHCDVYSFVDVANHSCTPNGITANFDFAGDAGERR